MIDLDAIRKEDIGKWVEYRGNCDEVEVGKIKWWNHLFIFVVYKCGGEWERFTDFTGVATSPKQLSFIVSGICFLCNMPFTKDNVCSDAGWRETKISGMCEKCFDNDCKDEDDA